MTEELNPARGAPYPVVGIGASAGGLEAISALLHALPPDTGMAFVVVQHLDRTHPSQLPELLARTTSMPVFTVEEGATIEPNHVYIIPPNADVTMAEGKLHLSQRKPGVNMPVDAFFASLAEAQGRRAIGIVLSGNATDGSLGLQMIKGEFGLTFAQDEASARYNGMPRNAAATGAVDFVMSPQEIALELVRISKHPYLNLPPARLSDQEMLPEGDGELRRIFSLLLANTKVDFTHYKRNTVRRRIGRRMIVQRTQKLSEYAKYLDHHPAEVKELYRDLLINVTSFFRDPEAFVILAKLIQGILAERKFSEPFRVWVPGCATGEELYSLAICLTELSRELPLQLFGTDINDVALEKARSGVYPEEIEEQVSPDRLHNFFIRVDRGYQIAKDLREACVFARQDLTRDPPFAHTDLISCRNVLIYMDAALQRRILPVFNYSLSPTGLLMLGSAETVGAAPELFEVLDKQYRIYGRRTVPLRLSLDLSLGRSTQEPPSLDQPTQTLSRLDLIKKVDRVIQSKYSPAAVVVDADLKILQFRGQTSFYFDPAPGDATLNLFRMVRDSLVVPLRRGIEAASSRGTSIRETGVSVEHHGEMRTVNLEITPVHGVARAEQYFLLVFDEQNDAPETAPPPSVPPQSGDSGEYLVELEIRRQLQQQLVETRDYQRNLNEDHEAGMEELRAANEEIRSSNEELQSINEELSTTKEELQSANEELTTVNEELQNRNHELDRLKNDLGNLLSAVNIPIVMVDGGLRLRRFNPVAEKLLELTSHDVGRPISLAAGTMAIPELEAMLKSVLETLSTKQQEVRDKQGCWYSLIARPYRTDENRIDGAVIIFVNIDPLKRSLRMAEEARDYAEGMIETVREPLVVLDQDLRVLRATSAFFNMFRVSREETIGRLLYDLGNGQWNQPKLRELLGNALFNDQPFHDYPMEHDFPHIGLKTVRLNAQQIPRQNDGRDRAVLLSIEDISLRQAEA